MAHELDHVHTLYIGALTGELQFGRRLIQALQQIGCFEFTDDRARADAVLEADGENTDDGFAGTLVLRDANGAELWSSHALRPHGSTGPMAYERLVDQIRAALPTTPLVH